MIQTSNFAKSGKNPNAVAISRGVPWWYSGKRLVEIAPTWEMLNDVRATGDTSKFDAAFMAQLEHLGAEKIMGLLGDNAVLLCWESADVRCHRRMVAEFLEERLGIEIPELGMLRSESVPYREQKIKAKWAKNAKSAI